jgi:hypothetical protein
MFGEDWWRLGLVAALLAGGAALSTAHALPARLPAASLGWPLLLHVERSVALLGLVAVALLIGVQAAKGRFPVRFGHVEYPVDDVGERLRATMAAHEERLELVEDAISLGLSTAHADSRYDG